MDKAPKTAKRRSTKKTPSDAPTEMTVEQYAKAYWNDVNVQYDYQQRRDVWSRALTNAPIHRDFLASASKEDIGDLQAQAVTWADEATRQWDTSCSLFHVDVDARMLDITKAIIKAKP